MVVFSVYCTVSIVIFHFKHDNFDLIKHKMFVLVVKTLKQHYQLPDKHICPKHNCDKSR